VLPSLALIFNLVTCSLIFLKGAILKTRKAPGALHPAIVPPPPPGGVKYVTVTQDKSPWLCSDRHDEYFFGRAKTGGLGQETTQKKPWKKKGTTRPRPDGWVKKFCAEPEKTK